MTFGELTRSYTWDEIVPVLLREYPDQEHNLGGHRTAFLFLFALEPVPSDVTLLIEWITDDELIDEPYVSVSGDLPSDDLRYSLMLTDWAEWLSMEIAESSLVQFTDVEILAHCLWEMTFVGYTPEEVKAADDELTAAYEGALEQIAEGDNA